MGNISKCESNHVEMTVCFRWTKVCVDRYQGRYRRGFDFWLLLLIALTFDLPLRNFLLFDEYFVRNFGSLTFLDKVLACPARIMTCLTDILC